MRGERSESIVGMKSLRLDLHTHLKPAKRIPFDLGFVDAYAATMRERRLGGVFVCEHVHAPDFWWMYNQIRAVHQYDEGRFEVEDMLFFPGFELTLAERVDVLVVAPLDELERIDNLFLRPLSSGFHPTADEFLVALEASPTSALRIAAHPSRRDKTIEHLANEQVKRIFEAVEINARYTPTDKPIAERYAELYEWPITGGSDAHTPPQLGAVYTEVHALESTGFDDLARAIREGRTSVHVDPCARQFVDLGQAEKVSRKNNWPEERKLQKRPTLLTEEGARLRFQVAPELPDEHEVISGAAVG